MVSSKGKPTDPQLREKVKDEVKNETNKDGSGKGQWSAWKASKLAKEYEAKGGEYENEAGSKNEPAKGTPKPKSSDKKDTELKGSAKTSAKSSAKKEASTEKSDKENETPTAKKATEKAPEKKEKAAPKKKAPAKTKKTPSEGTRRSSRVASKRSAPDYNEDKNDQPKKSRKSS